MLFPDGSNGDGYLPTADPGELLVSPDHHLKKQIWTLKTMTIFISVTDLSRALALPMVRDLALILRTTMRLVLDLALVLAVA
jgi:hypothetical protein